ncbi:MAG: THUMP domain-containing protein [archaeon]|nr:THUMP domain-containing protein [archaeon]
MYGFVIETDSNKSLRKFGDKIIIGLCEEEIISKYNTFGKKIFLETQSPLPNDRNYPPASMTTAEEKDIYSNINILIKRIKETKSFAIKVTRKGDHKYTSTGLARNVAGAVFDNWPNIKVDLKKPKLEVVIQIINNRSLIYIRD